MTEDKDSTSETAGESEQKTSLDYELFTESLRKVLLLPKEKVDAVIASEKEERKKRAATRKKKVDE